eukprot:9264391-Pyramimonas_sp.AAC.1
MRCRGQRRQRQRAQHPEEAMPEVPEAAPLWSLIGCEDGIARGSCDKGNLLRQQRSGAACSGNLKFSPIRR